MLKYLTYAYCKEYWTWPYRKQNDINRVLRCAEYITTCYHFNCINAWRQCSFSLWKHNTIAKWDYIYLMSRNGFNSNNALQNSHLITSKRSLHLDGIHDKYYARMVQSFKYYGSESKLRYWTVKGIFRFDSLYHAYLQLPEAWKSYKTWA
jgi:hypothetical protein